jgi:riboflavin kinase/FMN adenylyltransferase
VLEVSLPVATGLAAAADLAPRNSALTLGVFDGVHRGHRRIIDTLSGRRGQDGVKSVFVMTFDPHPVVVTHSRETPPILSSIEERIELLSDCDIDGVLVVPFDEQVASMDYRDFIKRYFIEAMDMKELVLGYDCHFGHKREGSPERVAEQGAREGFGVRIVPPVEYAGVVVSSTTIRNTLMAGEIGQANELLGHPYLVSGKVVQGEGRGADLGFPTANITPSNPLKLWPPQGVYAVRVGWHGQHFRGMMNVGSAPTVKGGDPVIEVHIFDFGNTLYGERLSVFCEAWIREERRFPTIDALIAQLATDREAAVNALGPA